MMTTPPAAARYRLPPAWIEVDPHASDLLERLLDAVDVPRHLDDLARTLLQPLAVELTRLAALSEVVSAGFFAHAIEIDGSADPLVLTANVLLAISPPVESPATAAGAGPDAEPVDLPAGPAVLVTGRTDVTDEQWDGVVPVRTRRYLVPVPGTDRLAVLAFQTPNIDLADQFDDVFAAIAESLAFDLPDGSPS